MTARSAACGGPAARRRWGHLAATLPSCRSPHGGCATADRCACLTGTPSARVLLTKTQSAGIPKHVQKSNSGIAHDCQSVQQAPSLRDRRPSACIHVRRRNWLGSVSGQKAAAYNTHLLPGDVVGGHQRHLLRLWTAAICKWRCQLSAEQQVRLRWHHVMIVQCQSHAVQFHPAAGLLESWLHG